MTQKGPEARLFISDLTVVYGDDPSEIPSDTVREMTGRSADINSGFGGKYVWLTPQYSSDSDSAATKWDLIIQREPDPTLSNIAKGAGGDYRYLRVVVDQSQGSKVTSVGLLRLDQAISGVPDGWSGLTGDINKGRGGTYLYLVWKTVAV